MVRCFAPHHLSSSAKGVVLLICAVSLLCKTSNFRGESLRALFFPIFNFMIGHNMSAARQIAALRSAVRRSVEGYVVDGVRGLLLAPLLMIEIARSPLGRDDGKPNETWIT